MVGIGVRRGEKVCAIEVTDKRCETRGAILCQDGNSGRNMLEHLTWNGLRGVQWNYSWFYVAYIETIKYGRKIIAKVNKLFLWDKFVTQLINIHDDTA